MQMGMFSQHWEPLSFLLSLVRVLRDRKTLCLRSQPQIKPQLFFFSIPIDQVIILGTFLWAIYQCGQSAVSGLLAKTQNVSNDLNVSISAEVILEMENANEWLGKKVTRTFGAFQIPWVVQSCVNEMKMQLCFQILLSKALQCSVNARPTGGACEHHRHQTHTETELLFKSELIMSQVCIWIHYQNMSL